MAAKKSLFAAAEAALRKHALGKPEATEHFPWGERAIKVKGKVFLFMFGDPTRLSLSTKLPDSSGVALMLPFAQPTGYGLGKAGWVTAIFDGDGDAPPVELLCAWIDESYRAVAPAKLAKALDAAPATTPRAPRSPASRPARAAPRPARAPAPKTPRRPAKPAAPARTSARRARGGAR